MLSKASGISYHQEGLLYDEELREHVLPSEVIMYDGMHVLYSNGIWQHETGLVLHKLSALPRWDDDDWKNFARADFRNHHHYGTWSGRANTVSAQREAAFKSNASFPCTASEMMMVLPVFLHYLQTVVAKVYDLGDVLASYEALADVCHLFQQCKFGKPAEPELRAAATRHLRLFKLAHGEDAATEASHGTALGGGFLPKGLWLLRRRREE